MTFDSILDLVRLSTGREMNTALLDNDKKEKKGTGEGRKSLRTYVGSFNVIFTAVFFFLALHYVMVVVVCSVYLLFDLLMVSRGRAVDRAVIVPLPLIKKNSSITTGNGVVVLVNSVPFHSGETLALID